MRRIALITVSLALLPASAAAAQERVSASPRPVHFGETLTVSGRGWPVIEFCSRNVRQSGEDGSTIFRRASVRLRIK